MANPNPVQPQAFKDQRLPKYGEVALGDPICVRYSAEVDAKLRAMGDRQAFIREAVDQKLAAQKTDLDRAISEVLSRIPPRDRAAASKLFRKLLVQLESQSIESGI